MEYIRIIFLGIVQGITEFLPVSSDGHLVVANKLFKAFSSADITKENLVVTIILHMGTLLAILIVYWRHIMRLLTHDRRVIGMLIVGTIPAAAAGLLLDKYLEEYMVSPLLTGLLLPINGLILLYIGRKTPGEVTYENLTYPKALFIGCCQAFAPLPGISRSGTTIAGGLATGLRRDAAATFSFLLAIPAISGAGVLGLIKLFTHGADDLPPTGVLLVGAVVSFVVGLVSLRLLLRLLREGLLDPFGYWCIGLGIVLVAWCLFGTPAAAPHKTTDPSAADSADAWVPLFDGATLGGWEAQSDANWHIADGAIKVDSGAAGLLVTPDEYGDFDLAVDFSAPPGTNSGVFLRTADKPTDPQVDCYELNIADTETSPFPTGSFVGRQKGNAEEHTAGWHSYVVTARGGHFVVALDGREVLDYTDPTPIARGKIGLQFNKGPVEFRAIKVKPSDALSAEARTAHGDSRDE